MYPFVRLLYISLTYEIFNTLSQTCTATLFLFLFLSMSKRMHLENWFPLSKFIQSGILSYFGLLFQKQFLSDRIKPFRRQLSSLIALRWVGLQTLGRSDLKTYLLMRWQGPDVLAICREHRGLTVEFLSLRYSVLLTVESLSLLYLLFIS